MVLCIITHLFLTPMLQFFGAPDNVLGYAKTYTNITSFGFPFLILATGGGHLIRADGSLLHGAVFGKCVDLLLYRTVLRNGLQHPRGCHGTVPAELMVREDQTSVLLPSEDASVIHHLPCHDRRSYCGTDHGTLDRFHRIVYDRGGRYRSDHLSSAVGHHYPLGQNGEGLVPGNIGPVAVHKDTAVGVPVMGYA